MHLRRVSLLSPSPKSCAAFYGERMGLAASFNGDMATIVAGSTVLEFRQCANTDWAPYHFAFNIPPNQFEQAQQWLAERVELLEEGGTPVFEFPSWNARALYFRDPDGNIVEFIARRDLPPAPNDAFGPDSILSVSEIGIVVPNVGDTVAFLAREFGLTRYSGDDDSFAAVGDPEGLFIAVPPGRVWYPTQGMRAIATPHAVEIEGTGESSATIPGTPYTVLATAPRP